MHTTNVILSPSGSDAVDEKVIIDPKLIGPLLEKAVKFGAVFEILKVVVPLIVTAEG